MRTTQMVSLQRDRGGVGFSLPRLCRTLHWRYPLGKPLPAVYCGVGWVADACAGAALCCVSTAGAVVSADPAAGVGAAVTGGA